VEIWFSDTRHTCVLALHGEFGLAEHDELRASLQAACEADRLVLVDFQDVTFIDSSGVGILVAAHRRCVEAEKQLVLMNVNGSPLRVLTMLGLQMLFTPPRSPQDASPAVLA
jgi:anti-anti-sigma factor